MANVQLAVAGDDTTQVILSVPGVQGPAGSNLPPSGTTHQLLYKQSSTDYDTAWKLITNDNVDAAAEIAVSKLADGSARQLLQTDAAGTGVEWTSNVDIPGTLDVTSAATFDAAVTTTGLLSASGKISVPLASGEGPSIYFGTDTDTGIYSPGANQVALSTNGTKRIEIQADGDINIDNGGVFYDASTNRLAIGTTSPNTPLEVNGSIRTSQGSGGIIQLYEADATRRNSISFGADANGSFINTFYNTGGSFDLLFKRGSTESARIDSSGRLLVGASSDSGGALLQVNGNRIRVATAKTPASASDSGTTGEICWDASYIYVCTATNTWKRAALSTW